MHDNAIIRRYVIAVLSGVFGSCICFASGVPPCWSGFLSVCRGCVQVYLGAAYDPYLCVC